MKKEHNSNEVDRIKAMYDRGDINGAENRCNELLQIYEKEQNPNMVMQLLGVLVTICTRSARYTEAEEIALQFSGEAGDVLWSLVSFASRLDEIVQLSASTFEPTHVAKYAFQLADQFNTFYQDKRFHILKESDAKRKTVLLMAVDVVRQKLAQALSLLGIEAPEKM